MRPIPEWMRPSTTADDWRTSPVPHRKSRSSAARRAAAIFARLIAEMLHNQQTARAPGLLQGIDARVKVVGALALIAVAAALRDAAALMGIGAVSVTLAALSRIPLGRIARMWLVGPVFSALVMLPSALNLVTPGRSVLTLHADPTIAVTDAGLMVAGRMILRVAVCVSLALLLAATTRPDRLFRGLRAVGVPVLFVMLLSMMERYLWVLARAAEEVHFAKISRSIAIRSTHEEQAWVAAGIGSLFRRTRALGHGVYLAMISRGYSGEVYLLHER